ncbi:hypothetical protein, conserved [Babesia bigemina]|uniref:Uncharacterized protein n=1 Tax=Babesia bigemina TaxID=5866 RepID=A0A061DE01_BABBI|nr:hypothetical protein, conserved [Babesia bigemina]CDR97829.1 hypothetical protein, conserved [Babesia bigemina]|eukprot:XP_012770015.1 hypothetical protein, conserved [Babesia bigemina]
MDTHSGKSEMEALNDLFSKAFAQYFMMQWCQRGYETHSTFKNELDAVVSIWPHEIPIQSEESVNQETANRNLEGEGASSQPGQAARDADRLRKFQVLKDLEYAFQLMMVACHKMHIFSSNERVEDVHTEDLKFLMLPYLAAHVGLEKPDLKQRLNVLKRCVVYLTEFIHTLIRMDAMHQRELVYWERNLGDIADERRTFRINSTKYTIEILGRMRPAFNTTEGIINFFKEANSKNAEEATLRARVLDLLHLFSFEAINLYDMIKMEIPLLERHLKEAGNPESNTVEEDKRSRPSRSKPWVIRVDGVSKLDPTTAHFLYQKLIFVPGHNLPNISLDECARIEMDMDVNTIGVRGAKENTRKDDSAEEDDGCRSGSESSSSDDSDRDSDDTKEKAAWDDWKDDHPRGSGNKNRNVG